MFSHVSWTSYASSTPSLPGTSPCQLNLFWLHFSSSHSLLHDLARTLSTWIPCSKSHSRSTIWPRRHAYLEVTKLIF